MAQVLISSQRYDMEALKCKLRRLGIKNTIGPSDLNLSAESRHCNDLIRDVTFHIVLIISLIEFVAIFKEKDDYSTSKKIKMICSLLYIPLCMIKKENKK